MAALQLTKLPAMLLMFLADDDAAERDGAPVNPNEKVRNTNGHIQAACHCHHAGAHLHPRYAQATHVCATDSILLFRRADDSVNLGLALGLRKVRVRVRFGVGIRMQAGEIFSDPRVYISHARQ